MLIYIDDSGDTGLVNSRTHAFVLAAVIVKDHDWLATLDALKGFRKSLSKNFGIRQRDELKAGYLIHGTGSCAGLSERARMNIYTMALRFQQKIGTIKTWAIVIDKATWASKYPRMSNSIRDVAWQNMIERIERYTSHENETCTVYPDEGHPKFVSALFRKMRRFSTPPSAYKAGQTLSRPANLIVEDPNFRISKDSYFVQLADLNAYAAHRHCFPTTYFGANYWDELGDARVKDVGKIRGGPLGVKLRP